MKDEKLIVVIPARGGSKRIPNKNIKKVCGQPMIYWPLMKIAKLFSKEQILVSTDSIEIKNVVENKGIKIPFIRPHNLSDDFTTSIEVLKHSLKWFEEKKFSVDYVVMIYPTAILLDEMDIKNAFVTIKNDMNCDIIMSGTTYPHPIQRSFFEDSNGYAKMSNPDTFLKRTQDLPNAIHDVGQFYIFRSNLVRSNADITSSNIRIHKLSPKKAIDIDNIEDLDLAKMRMKELGLDKFDNTWQFD